MNDKDKKNLILAATSAGITKAEIKTMLDMLADMEEEPKEKVPAIKKQLCILVSDPAGIIKTDLVGWVVQIPEEESPATIEERVFRAAYDFNATKRGQQHPIKTVGEAMESVGAKQFKEAGIWVKTKTPVLIVTTRNEIPKTDGLLSDGNRGDYTSVEIRTSKGGVRIDADGITAIDKMRAAEETQ